MGSEFGALDKLSYGTRCRTAVLRQQLRQSPPSSPPRHASVAPPSVSATWNSARPPRLGTSPAGLERADSYPPITRLVTQTGDSEPHLDAYFCGISDAVPAFEAKGIMRP